eukprot:m.226378 g.226378  ORF g.226378 m.226378 type:complete len:165 (+) comp19219_c0_seq35:1937-2431(+)
MFSRYNGIAHLCSIRPADASQHSSLLRSALLTACWDLLLCTTEGDDTKWSGATKRPPTAGRAFVDSMKSMINLLNTKIPSYVRCIKSNDKKQPMTLNNDMLRHQVQYLGLVENIRVRRAGFCFRQPFDEFKSRYALLSKAVWSCSVPLVSTDQSSFILHLASSA